ncbi:hypothetical protein [Cohnella abietis]|nr:hypothetical protein [Cohnella abietis]
MRNTKSEIIRMAGDTLTLLILLKVIGFVSRLMATAAIGGM